MKKFSYVVFVFVLIYFFGCTKTVDISAKEPKWDRDVCARCSMQVSDRLHSAQIVDPKDGNNYFFDDLGCASLWLEGKDSPLKENAVLYVTEGVDGKWLKSGDAVFATSFVTPMAFGVAAFSDIKSIPEGKTVITYAEAVDVFKNTMKERMMKKQKKAESEAPAMEGMK